MRRARTCILALVALLAGCGEAPPRPLGASLVTTSRVELGEIEIVEGTGARGFRVHADGRIAAFDGTPIGMLKASGELLNAAGQSVATLDDAGRVDLGAEVQDAAAVIHEDGSMVVTPRDGAPIRLQIGAGGLLEASPRGREIIVVRGADTAGKRRATMLLVLAIGMRRQRAEPPTSSSSAAPPKSGAPETP